MKPLLPKPFDASQSRSLHLWDNIVQVKSGILQVRGNLSRLSCLDRIGELIEN
jgi:hypothetical protein